MFDPTTFDNLGPSTPMKKALAAHARIGEMSWSDLQAYVLVGTSSEEIGADFHIPVRRYFVDAYHDTNTFLLECAAVDIKLLNNFLRVDVAGILIPVEPVALDAELNVLLEHAESSPLKYGAPQWRQLAAIAQIRKHLAAIHAAYVDFMARLWDWLHEAELIANAAFRRHLHQNLTLLSLQRQRYFPNGTGLPNNWRIVSGGLTLSDPYSRKEAETRYASRMTISTELAELMRVSQALLNSSSRRTLKEALRDTTYASGLGLTLSAVAAVVFLHGGATTDIPSNLSQYGQELNKSAKSNREFAAINYLADLSRHGQTHPLVYQIVAIDEGENIEGYLSLVASIVKAIEKCELSINRLIVESKGAMAFPQIAGNTTYLKPDGMADRIVNTGHTSVWRLPFLMEDSLNSMDLPGSGLVQRIRELAAERESSQGLTRMLALAGIQVPLTIASIAGKAGGPYGAALSILTSIPDAFDAIRSDRELTDLFRASLSPGTIFRGMDHGPTSTFDLTMALLGLIP